MEKKDILIGLLFTTSVLLFLTLVRQSKNEVTIHTKEEIYYVLPNKNIVNTEGGRVYKFESKKELQEFCEKLTYNNYYTD